MMTTTVPTRLLAAAGFALLLHAPYVVAVAAQQQPCPENKPLEGAWKGTPLHEAIRRNDAAAAGRLMTAATVNELDSFGNTPLIAALTPVAALEPAGVLSPAKTRARMNAELKARQTIVSALLSKGASAQQPGARGNTPLIQLAAGAGFPPVVDRRFAEAFLTQQPPRQEVTSTVNAQDDFGVTALMMAARRGSKDLVTLLLSKGADRNIRNCHGETAASLAKFGGHAALAEMLAGDGSGGAAGSGSSNGVGARAKKK